MAKRLTWYILAALVLGLITGWAINANIGDATPEAIMSRYAFVQRCTDR